MVKATDLGLKVMISSSKFLTRLNRRLNLSATSFILLIVLITDSESMKTGEVRHEEA